MNLRAYQPPLAPSSSEPERRIDGMTRGEVCERYRRKITQLARRVCERAGPDCPFGPEDMVGYGVLGLLEAFERFDGDRGAEFDAYARCRMAGRMLDALRAAGGTTRRDRRVARSIERAASEARAVLGREPGHTEIARFLGVDLETYWRARGWAEPIELLPLERDPVGWITPPEGPATILAHDTRTALRAAIARLPERERTVVLLYYARECSLAEIGEILEVTPSRVCQVLGAARARLRVLLADDVAVVDLEGAA